MDGLDGVIIRKRIYLEDLDGFGMLHHARYAVLFDNAVLDFWLDAGWSPDTATHLAVIRELSLTYHDPIVGMGDVDVHLWVDRAGRTSVTYRFRILSTDHSVLHAEGHRGLVNVDARTLRPAPLTDEMWTFASPLLAAGVERPAA
jgi:acyl-CoA thioester hydrolase